MEQRPDGTERSQSLALRLRIPHLSTPSLHPLLVLTNHHQRTRLHRRPGATTQRSTLRLCIHPDAHRRNPIGTTETPSPIHHGLLRFRHHRIHRSAHRDKARRRLCRYDSGRRGNLPGRSHCTFLARQQCQRADQACHRECNADIHRHFRGRSRHPALSSDRRTEIFPRAWICVGLSIGQHSGRGDPVGDFED